MRFLVFIGTVTAVLGLASFYLGARIITGWPWAGQHAGTVWLAFALFVALQFLGPYLYRVYPNRLNRFFIVHWVTYTTLGIFGCLVLYSMAADVLGLLWNLAFGPGLADRAGFLTMLAMVAVTTVVGFWQAVTAPKVYRVDVPIEGLPAAFDGFRIVQVSDVHLGPTLGVRFARRAARVANELHPDLLALTGDFVDGPVETLGPVIEPFGGIAARHGSLFVPGNHEYYWDVRGWIEEFRKLGARVLLNEHVVLSRGADQIVVAGVTDYSAGHMLPGHASDPGKALHGAPERAVKILLAHHPESWRAAERAGFDLQLSGHTHGGQFFPFSLLVRLTHRYTKGLHRHGKLWIYVSRGTGYWGPPLRFGVPGEVTLICLRSAT